MKLATLLILLVLLPAVYAVPAAVTGGSVGEGSGASVPGSINSPIASNGAPIGVVTTNRPTLSVVTDRSATCKGNFDADADYAGMGFQFAGTGLTHSFTLTYDLNDGSHIAYVRCADDVGTSTSSYTWIFTVSTGGGGGGGGGGGITWGTTVGTTTVVETTVSETTTQAGEIELTEQEEQLKETLGGVVDDITGRFSELVGGNEVAVVGGVVAVIVLIIIILKREFLMKFIQEKTKPKYKFEW